MYGDQHQYKYMTVDDMKSLGDDSMRMDVTRDEKGDYRNSYGKIEMIQKVAFVVDFAINTIFRFQHIRILATK